jgi:hypothetical protein
MRLDRLMLRKPRSLGPRPEAAPEHAIVLANTRAWAREQYAAFDAAPGEWQSLYRDFNAEAINDVINERRGQVSCAGIRKRLEKRQGNGHPLYDMRADRYV